MPHVRRLRIFVCSRVYAKSTHRTNCREHNSKISTTTRVDSRESWTVLCESNRCNANKPSAPRKALSCGDGKSVAVCLANGMVALRFASAQLPHSCTRARTSHIYTIHRRKWFAVFGPRTHARHRSMELLPVIQLAPLNVYINISPYYDFMISYTSPVIRFHAHHTSCQYFIANFCLSQSFHLFFFLAVCRVVRI